MITSMKSGFAGAVASALLLVTMGTAKAGSLPYTTTGTFSGTDSLLSGGSQLTFLPSVGSGSASLTFAGVTSSLTTNPITLGAFTLSDTFTQARLLTSPTDAFTLTVTESASAGSGSVTSDSLLGLISYHSTTNSLEIDFDPANSIVIGNDSYHVNDVFFTPAIGGTSLSGSISVSPQNGTTPTPLPTSATAGLGLLTALLATGGFRKVKQAASNQTV